MKKVLLILLLVGFTAISQAALVDDFENYNTGAVAAGNGSPPWTTSEAAGFYADIMDDGAGNQFISQYASGDYRDIRTSTPISLGDSTVGTLFFRVYVNDETGLNHALGMTDMDDVDWYDEFSPMIRFIDNASSTDSQYQLSIRDDTAYVDNAAQLNVGQWYNLWLVIDTAGEGIGTFDIYLTQGNSDATESNKITFTGAPAGFRRHYTSGNPLDMFVMMAGTSPEAIQYNLLVDDIYLSPGKDLSYPSIHTKAWEPNPHNTAENVGTANATKVKLNLQWKTGLDPCDANNPNPDITNHLLYLDTNSAKLMYTKSWKEVNLPAGGPPPANDVNWAFYDLVYDTTYYWRVNEVLNNGDPNSQDPNEVITGDIWSFTTIGQSPKILVQPADKLGEDSENVVFTVGVSSATQEHYQWYKSNDVYPDVGDSTIGTDSNTLTVTANTTNDAYYYVKVTNDADTVTSNVVHLWLAREIARWRLNNDLTDSSTAAKGGTAEWDEADDPCDNHQGANGFDPCAIEGSHSGKFYDDVNAFISVPGSEDYFNHYVVGLTASCWVKVDPGVTGYDAVITKHSLSTSDVNGTVWEGWTLQLNAGTPLFEVRHGGVYAGASASIADSNWHMLTAVYDVDNGRGRLYVDGLLDGNDVAITPGSVQKTPLDRFAIASCDANDGGYHVNPFDGLIDDVRIFTYPMTSTEVAGMYVEHVTDATICIDSINPVHDYSGNCKVGLEDLAMLAAGWLDCNLYPESACDE
ncbi:MAG: hypothetical protein JW804_09600 [Sedimentisphaerales bacterium]|nr:hypothetical protein [Sedimentisphaerales bacterium]